MRGQDDHSRPIDIVVLDYVAPGKHLLLDGVVTNTYRNTRVRETRSIPGYTSKLVEDKKLYADMTSERSVSTSHGGRHILVSFAVEGGGRLGAHAQSFLYSLEERVVSLGRRSRAPFRYPSVLVGPDRDGSATSLRGFTCPCLGNSFGYYAHARRRMPSSPRVKTIGALSIHAFLGCVIRSIISCIVP